MDLSTLDHPCFNASVCAVSARMHLPVADRCNLQCGFCRRELGCVNESRPGVAVRLMDETRAAEAVDEALRRYPIKVIGIAGPGDPLASPEKTLRVLKMVRERFPEIKICLSTNGLALADWAEELIEVGLRYITVTVNAVDPKIGADIYSWVGEPASRGVEGAELLLEAQKKGLEIMSASGAVIKINTVCIPDINMGHIPEIAEFAAKYHAAVHNIVPLIPLEGTPMAARRKPSVNELSEARKAASAWLPVMSHCTQCRADAVGFLEKTERRAE